MNDRTLVIKDSDHSWFGPSSGERNVNCPANVGATRHIASVSSTYAMEGTAAHGVAEECDRRGLRADHFLGWTIRVDRTDGKSEFPCTQEMVDAVNVFLDYCDDLPGINLCESIVTYENWVPNGFGTMDRAKIDHKTAHVIDLKYGKGVQVFAEDNTQGKMYALGLYHDYGWIFEDVEEFTFHVVQPRIDHIDSWTISKKDLLQWADDVLAPAALQASGTHAPFKAGKWCQFCKIKATCMVRASDVFKSIAGEFDDLDAVIASEPAPIATLSNEQIAKILPNVKNIADWCAAIKSHAMGEIASGHPIGDWKVVEGRSNRKWGATEEEIVAALDEANKTAPDGLGIEFTRIYEPRQLLSPSKLEGLLGKNKKILTSLIVKPTGAPTLVPGSDKRPVLSIDPSTEFENLNSAD